MAAFLACGLIISHKRKSHPHLANCHLWGAPDRQLTSGTDRQLYGGGLRASLSVLSETRFRSSCPGHDVDDAVGRSSAAA
jgi:hypothetical protein